MFAACDIYPTEGIDDSEPSGSPVKGIPCDFEGSIEMDGFVWNSTSDIGVFGLSDGAIVKNQRCKIDGWGYEPPKGYYEEKEKKGEKVERWEPSKYEGLSNALFHSVKNLDVPEGMNEYLVCAPYTANLIYVPSERTIYDLAIAHEQTQTQSGLRNTPLSLGVAKGNTADESVKFSLDPVAACIKISLASTEFEGYYVSKINVVSSDAPVSGEMDYAIDSKAMVINKSFYYVNLAITKPQPLSATEPQVFYIDALPGNHTEDLTITFTMSTASSTVSLPVAFKAQDLVAGQTAELTYANLKSSDNKVGAWFCPIESRKLVGPGYAYGQANTFFIQSKSVVYNGATLTPNPDIPEEVVIDYRLRGDYSKAEIPDDVTFEWLTKNGSTIVTSRTDSKFVADKYSFKVDPANYTVTVKNEGSTAGAPILIMKKNGKVLWGWSFWNIAADGTVIEPVNIGGVEMANMAIGQPTYKDEWIKVNAAGHFVRTLYYYQFGRYLPIFWDSYTSLYWSYNAEGQTPISGTGNMYAINGPFKTFAESLEHPAGFVVHNGTDNAMSWCLESNPDLWGCEVGSPKDAGTKTQFDPCPKGWRVPDYSVADILVAEFKGYNTTAGFLGYYAGSTESNAYNFLFAGEWDGRKIATNGRCTGYGTGGTWSASWPQYYWTNYMASASTNNARAFGYFASTAGKNPQVYDHQIVTGAPIRCQKDKDNR